jgi:Ni/Co efflux regulator RcnB
MIDVFTETFKSESKTIEYIQSRLRSASDIYKKGGHVTMVYRDQQFRMHFYNKRVLEDPLVI